MTDRNTVYNAIESYQTQFESVTKIAVLVGVPLSLFVLFSLFRKPSSRAVGKSKARDRVSPLILFLMYFVATGAFLSNASSSAKKARYLLQTQSYEIVQGQYVEGKKTRRAHEFSVSGVKFSYAPDGTYNPGRFDNNCKRDLCQISEGMNVRIYHYETEILLIELLD